MARHRSARRFASSPMVPRREEWVSTIGGRRSGTIVWSSRIGVVVVSSNRGKFRTRVEIEVRSPDSVERPETVCCICNEQIPCKSSPGVIECQEVPPEN